MTEANDCRSALIRLHRGHARQGPGDEAFSREVLAGLPALGTSGRVADLGCGSGAGTLLLAECLQRPVIAVDLSPDFVAQLTLQATQRGLSPWITAEVADIGALAWPPASLHLLWSEGAAYNLGFARALRTWRPLVAGGGIAVVSELSWFTGNPPEPARKFWKAGYPGLGSEAENRSHARDCGFEVIDTLRLPSRAWWDNYYGPLQQRIVSLRADAGGAMRAVIAETEREMDLFARYSDSYGYTFYILRAP